MKRDFLKLLKTLEEEELREELRALYERFPAVREYYKLELSTSTREVVDKYKKGIRKAFFTGRGRRMGKRGRSASKKIIKDFAAVSIHPRDVVELHFYRVAVMVEAIAYFGVTSDSFFDSLISAYEQACVLAEREVLLDTFREPAHRIVLLAAERRLSLRHVLEAVHRRHWPEG